jgi:hypothetical protein
MPANPASTLLSRANHSLMMIDRQYRQMRAVRTRNCVANTMLTK